MKMIDLSVPIEEVQAWAWNSCEDCNCNGTFDSADPSNPRLADTDGDTIPDWDENRYGDGIFRAENQHSRNPKGKGCSLVSGASVDWSMMTIFAALMLVIVGVRRKLVGRSGLRAAMKSARR